MFSFRWVGSRGEFWKRWVGLVEREVGRRRLRGWWLVYFFVFLDTEGFKSFWEELFLDKG